MIKKPCIVCGAAYVHAHHSDYSKPLDIMWLCPAHHKQEHANSKPVFVPVPKKRPENVFERMREAFSYDPITGFIIRTRSVSAGNGQIGSRVGMPNYYGYRTMHFERKQYQEHEISWLLYYGEFPTNRIIHVNGDGTDNRICNLKYENEPTQEDPFTFAKSKEKI